MYVTLCIYRIERRAYSRYARCTGVAFQCGSLQDDGGPCVENHRYRHRTDAPILSLIATSERQVPMFSYILFVTTQHTSDPRTHPNAVPSWHRNGDERSARRRPQATTSARGLNIISFCIIRVDESSFRSVLGPWPPL